MRRGEAGRSIQRNRRRMAHARAWLRSSASLEARWAAAADFVNRQSVNAAPHDDYPEAVKANSSCLTRRGERLRCSALRAQREAWSRYRLLTPPAQVCPTEPVLRPAP
jgi:hypothetical protein